MSPESRAQFSAAALLRRVALRNYSNNRVHLDIAVDDVSATVERVIALGGSVQRREAGYTVMVDPEGNQFCLVPAQSSSDQSV